VRIVSAEKNEMAEEAHRIITTIKQMESSLDDSKDTHDYNIEDPSLKVSYPLIQCLQTLKEKHLQISKIHKERFEQVKSEYYSQGFIFL
jgi:protein regulator of cytokinesis 1